MTDIVDRLRAVLSESGLSDTAADEIEALRLRLAEIEDELDDAIRCIDRARGKVHE